MSQLGSPSAFLFAEQVNHGNLELLPCAHHPYPTCTRSHNLRRATATVHVSICLVRSTSFALPHSACHALLQSHRVGILRALAPLLVRRTDDVRCQYLLHSPARSHRFSTSSFASWLHGLRNGFREASSSLPLPLTFLPCMAALDPRAVLSFS